MTKVIVTSVSRRTTGLNNWSNIVISKELKFCAKISLKTIEDIFTFINDPRDDDIGTVNNTLDGILYFELTRLHVNISESTGDIFGV
jgi:hypothetical protein